MSTNKKRNSSRKPAPALTATRAADLERGEQLLDLRSQLRAPGLVCAPPASECILIAGIGNILLGDDGFGVEVAWELQKRLLPENVQVTDFGIRSYDLVYALTDERRGIILVDATQRGQPPGTVYVIKPDLEQLDQLEAEGLNPHSLDPARVLQMARALGAQSHNLYLVGCEPAVLESEDGQIGLSQPVRAAVPRAIAMITSLVNDILIEKSDKEPGLVCKET